MAMGRIGQPHPQGHTQNPVTRPNTKLVCHLAIEKTVRSRHPGDSQNPLCKQNTKKSVPRGDGEKLENHTLKEMVKSRTQAECKKQVCRMAIGRTGKSHPAGSGQDPVRRPCPGNSVPRGSGTAGPAAVDERRLAAGADHIQSLVTERKIAIAIR